MRVRITFAFTTDIPLYESGLDPVEIDGPHFHSPNTTPVYPYNYIRNASDITELEIMESLNLEHEFLTHFLQKHLPDRYDKIQHPHLKIEHKSSKLYISLDWLDRQLLKSALEQKIFLAKEGAKNGTI